MSDEVRLERPVIREVIVAGTVVTDYVESVDIQESLNAPVQVTVSFQPGVTDLTDGDFVRMAEALVVYSNTAGKFQNHAFNRGSDPDFHMNLGSITLGDTVLGDKKFTGYIVGVGFNTGLYENGITVTAVSEVAILDLAAPSLYDDEYSTAVEGRRADILRKIGECNSLSLMFELQREFAKPLYDSPNTRRANLPDDVIEEQKFLVRVGEPAWNMWLRLVGGIQSEMWREIMNINPLLPDRKAMYGRLSSTIRSAGPGGLFGALLGFCEEFQLLYVPTWSGPGKLVGREDVFSADPEEFALDAGQLRFNVGAQNILPAARVLIKQTTVRDRSTTNTSVLSVYPEKTDVTGVTLELPPPSWWSERNIGSRKLLEDKDPEVGQGFNFESLEKALGVLATSKDVYIATAQKILKRWAAAIYRWTALREFSGSMDNLPFRPDISAGKYVKFGGGIATGLSQSVHHTLTVRERSLKASTSIQFSHMKFATFELPGGNA